MLLANYFSEADDPHDINAPGVTRGVAGSRWLFDNALGIPSDDLLPDEARALRPAAYRIVAERSATRFWLKAHDMQARLAGGDWLFPPEATGVAVYIIRNPLDVAVSNAFHDGHGDMARAVAKLCDPAMEIGHRASPQMAQHLGDWSAHVISWTDQIAIPVLVVRYEDMLADAGAELVRVIRFSRPEVAIEPEKIERAVRHSRLEALQVAEDRHGFRERPRRAERFFREGRAGAWRNLLSPDQVSRMEVHHGEVMRRFGYVTPATQGLVRAS